MPNEQVVTFDKENNLYKTTFENKIEVEASSFRELLQNVQKKRFYQSIEKTFTEDKNIVMLDQATVVVKEKDGRYHLLMLEEGLPKEFYGKSVEEAFDSYHQFKNIEANIEELKQKTVSVNKSSLDRIEPNNHSKYGIDNYEDLANFELLTKEEKAMVERIYANAEKQGYKDFYQLQGGFKSWTGKIKKK